MRRLRGCGLLALTFALLGFPAWAAPTQPAASPLPSGPPAPAAPDNLTPDRPGFTNGSDTVVPGRVQVEGGITGTSAQAAAGGGQTTDYPAALIRIGLRPALELRATLPDYVSPPGGGAGFGDGSLGFRYKFYQSKDGNTKAALTPALSVPVKSAVTTSGHVDPSLLLSGQTQSGARWGISSNLILAYPTRNGGRVTDFTATGQVTYALSGPCAVFGDVYDDLPQGGPPSPIADSGFTYRLTPNLQLDIETGRGLGGAAPVRFYGGGVSTRF